MPVTFESEAQREGYETLVDYVTVLGIPFVARPDVPVLEITYGNAPPLIMGIQTMGEDRAVVVFVSYLVKNINLTAKVMRHLLERTWSRVFGALAIDDDGWIILGHAIHTSDIGRESLADIINLLTDASEAKDLISRYGGETVGEWS